MLGTGTRLDPGSRVYFFRQGGIELAEAYHDADFREIAARPVVANSMGRIPPLFFKPGVTVWASIHPPD